MRKVRYVLLRGVIFTMLGGLLIGGGAAKAAEQLKVLVIGALAPGTSTYACAVAAGDVIRKHTNLGYAVSPHPGLAGSLELMKTGQVHLAVGQGSDVTIAYKGATGPFSGLKLFPDVYPFLRQVQVVHYSDQLLWACADTDIHNAKDIRGKKVPAGFTAQPLIDLRVKALLANQGLRMDDVVPVKVSGWRASMQAASRGRVDVVLSTVSNKMLTELKARRGIRAIPLNTSPEAVKRMQEFYPGSIVRVVERDPFYSSQKDVLPEKFPAVVFWTRDVITSANISDEVIYKVSKALWENYKELHVMRSFKRDWKPENMCSANVGIPYHPGAVRWFKEKGVWTAELEALNERLLKR